VGEDHSRYQVNEVVTTQADHQGRLTQTGQQGELGETLPAVRLELQEVDHTAAYVA
jgi:hypothetical protein